MTNFPLSADQAWIDLTKTVLARGDLCLAQNDAGNSVEVLGHTSRVSMSECVLTHPKRKLGYRFQAAEAWWILSGDDRVETIAPYSKSISQFSDDGVKFFGAYGPKVVPQLAYVVAELRRDPQSRRAVVNIWRESPPAGSRDYPCTLSLQFLLREGQLHCVATMRSSDLWLGWPYDVFNFSCVVTMVALMLEGAASLGQLTLTVGSQHVYTRNFGAATEVAGDLDVSLQPAPRLCPHLFGSPQEFLSTLKAWADGPGSLEGLRQLNLKVPHVQV